MKLPKITTLPETSTATALPVSEPVLPKRLDHCHAPAELYFTRNTSWEPAEFNAPPPKSTPPVEALKYPVMYTLPAPSVATPEPPSTPVPPIVLAQR